MAKGVARIAWLSVCMAIGGPWVWRGMLNRGVGGWRRAAQHGIFVADDPPRELEGLIAVVCLGCAHGTIEHIARERRCGRLLERRDQFARGDEAVAALLLRADIG